MNVLNQINILKCKLEYVNQVLAVGGIEKWEAKEYCTMSLSYENEIKELEIYVAANKELFS